MNSHSLYWLYPFKTLMEAAVFWLATPAIPPPPKARVWGPPRAEAAARGCCAGLAVGFAEGRRAGSLDSPATPRVTGTFVGGKPEDADSPGVGVWLDGDFPAGYISGEGSKPVLVADAGEPPGGCEAVSESAKTPPRP